MVEQIVDLRDARLSHLFPALAVVGMVVVAVVGMVVVTVLVMVVMPCVVAMVSVVVVAVSVVAVITVAVIVGDKVGLQRGALGNQQPLFHGEVVLEVPNLLVDFHDGVLHALRRQDAERILIGVIRL